MPATMIGINNIVTLCRKSKDAVRMNTMYHNVIGLNKTVSNYGN